MRHLMPSPGLLLGARVIAYGPVARLSTNGTGPALGVNVTKRVFVPFPHAAVGPWNLRSRFTPSTRPPAGEGDSLITWVTRPEVRTSASASFEAHWSGTRYLRLARIWPSRRQLSRNACSSSTAAERETHPLCVAVEGESVAGGGGLGARCRAGDDDTGERDQAAQSTGGRIHHDTLIMSLNLS